MSPIEYASHFRFLCENNTQPTILLHFYGHLIAIDYFITCFALDDDSFFIDNAKEKPHQKSLLISVTASYGLGETTRLHETDWE